MTDEHTVSHHTTGSGIRGNQMLSHDSKALHTTDHPAYCTPRQRCSSVEKFELKPHLMIANGTEAVLNERHKPDKRTDHGMPLCCRKKKRQHLTSRLSFPIQNETHVVQAGSWVCLYAPPKRDTQPLTEFYRTQHLHDRRHQDSLRRSCPLQVFQDLLVASSFQGGFGCV